MTRHALCALAALFLLHGAHAGGFTLNRNAAHIDWRTAETEHFRFHYPRELEDVAGHIAGIAEEVAADKLARYAITLPNKVEFVVRDDIFSNGWANALQNTMTVWATDWDFPVRGTHNWIRDVVTHEFAHLVSIQSGSKLPSFLQGVVAGFEGYYNAPLQPRLATIFPFTHQPAWFAEGVAQYESELSGYDAWDSHRDMLLRISALENRLLPIERMSVFAGNALEYELGPYTQGFALTRFIAERYGDEAVLRLWAENARIHRQTMSGSMQRVLGKSDREVFREWRSEITARYTDQVRDLGELHQGQKLTSKGFYNYYPRWDAKGEGVFFVSNAGRDDFRATLGRVALEDTVKPEEERFEPVPGIRGFFDVAADDSTFLYASARERDRNGVHTLDIYQRNLRRDARFFERQDPTEKRFTRDLNAVHPNYAPDGTRIAFVYAEASNFFLAVAPVPEGDSLDAEDVRTLFPPPELLERRFGFNIYTPKFSPDGERILFSWFDGAERNIGIINADGSGFQGLVTGPEDARDPEWDPDGNSFYYASDKTGIFNLYRFDLTTGDTEPVTNVLGGAFLPSVSPDGERIAYVNYDRDGFSIYVLHDPVRVNVPAASHLEQRHATSAPPALEFAGLGRSYTPVPTRGILTPILFGQQTLAATREKGVIPEQGVTKWLAGASGYLTDPVLKNELSAVLLAEIGNGFAYFGRHSALVSPDKESQLYVDITNNATPVTLQASFFRGNLNTFDTVTVRDQPQPGGGVADEQLRQDYALTFRSVEAAAAYNLFDAQAVGTWDRPSHVRMALGYDWNDFNFYDLGGGQGFAFTYYKSLRLTTSLNLHGSGYSDKGLVAPRGFAAILAHTFRESDLFGCDSDYISDCFDFEGGALRPRYQTYRFHELDAGATYGRAMPWSRNASIVASVFASSLADWSLTRSELAADTLDRFFERGLFLRGYPFLRDIESLAFGGENSITLSLDLNQPLIADIYRNYWTVFVEDLYLHLFWEAGRAWNGSMWDAELFSPSAWTPERRADGWYQSVGGGLKLNARIYHNYPFLVYFQAARALSGLPDGEGGFIALDNVRVAGFETPASRIEFGVSFGLYSGLLTRRSERHPLNPESPFARR